MAVSHPSTFDLRGFNLGIGDLSVLAGVARNVVNWITSPSQDQSFLELLGLDISVVVPRKGLLNIIDLERHWSKRVTIIREGTISTYDAQKDRAIKLPQLNYFTWFMTLVTAALSTSMLESCVDQVLEDFFISVCEDEQTRDYSSHASHKQVQGWKSTATVRGILQAARAKWVELERQQIHQPGLMPAADMPEIGIFLRWLAGHTDYSTAEGNWGPKECKASYNLFRTASSDVFAIAMVLDYLGIAMQTVSKTDLFTEGSPVIMLDPDTIVSSSTSLSMKRRGMRVNLACVEETISLWPGSPDQNHRRREIFLQGTKAAEGLNLVASQGLIGPEFSRGVRQVMVAVLYKQSFRQHPIMDLCKSYLLGPRQLAFDNLAALVGSWDLSNNRLQEVIRSLVRLNSKQQLGQNVQRDILEDFQIFLLGYYYEVIRPLLDTSKMIVSEAFGAWTWNDMELCELVWNLQRDRMDGGSASGECSIDFYKKADILRIAAYLYAGAEMYQIQKINLSSCGIVSKLALLDSTMMGDTDTPTKISRFCLIDADVSYFPTNAIGVMSSATQLERPTLLLPPSVTENISTAQETSGKGDFTSIVEPDWTLDNQSSVVAFRHKGRIVSRVSPNEIFWAVLNSFPLSLPIYPSHNSEAMYYYSKYSQDSTGLGKVPPALAWQINLEAFEGNTVPIINFSRSGKQEPDPDTCVYVPTSGLVKARACVASIYPYEKTTSMDWNRDRPEGCSNDTLVINYRDYQLLLL
ncbi:hypothetical protein F5Y04DRAFT_253385 [Hypomontagnella monticulosa]|nr:hypothetical protein F5Y04DRAFT_253385 [Hypomontagnella monticulosa]